MRLSLGLVALVVTAVIAGPPASRAAGWDGTWAYEFPAGRNAADTGMVVDYRLRLTQAGCRLHAEGYQTDETIRCAATPDGSALRVRFTSYDDGAVTNKYGVAIYKPGDTLFTLTRQSGKVITTFGAYNLLDDKPHPPGVYFHRK